MGLAFSPVSAVGGSDARQGFADETRPRRVGWRSRQQSAPFAGGGDAVAVLLVCEPEVVAGFRVVRIASDGLLERMLGVISDDTICGRYQRFAESGLSRRTVAVERDCFAPGRDRVVRPAHPQIDRRQYFPARAVIRIAGKMRLDLADQAFDRLMAWHAIDACESGLVGHIGRSEPQIKSERDSRHHDDCGKRSGAATPQRR